MEESNNPTTGPTVEDWIVGIWDWKERLINSRAAPPPKNRITPESAGYTEQRRFWPNGQVEFYKDGKLIGTYPYRIEPRAAPASANVICYIYIGESKQPDGTVRHAEELMITPETLKIGHGMDEGCGSYSVFVRVKMPSFPGTAST